MNNINKEKYPGYKKIDIREIQHIQLEAMKHIHRICVENNISYYLIAGSILGAVRHGGFIPWDDDIDIALMREDYEKFKIIFEEKYDKRRYFLQHYETDTGHKPAIMRLCVRDTILDMPGYMHQKFCHNMYLDIFPLDNVPEDEKLREMQSKRIAVLRKKIKHSDYTDYTTNSTLRVFLKRIVASFYSMFLKKYKQELEQEMMRYDNAPSNCVCSMASGYSYSRQSMPKDYYGTPTLIKFEDTTFYGPEHADLYLRHLYGDDYMTPRNKFANGHAHDVYLRIM